MITRGVIALVASLGLLGLSGCYESNQGVTVHKQGVYMGAQDPLLEQQAAGREDALRKRFELVQVDR